MDCSGAIESAGYNLIGDTSGCAFTSTTGDKLNEDPLLLGQLVSLAGYYPLLSGSPAIDAANPTIPGSGGSACSAIDQRGVARPQGSACDMGAYEYTTPGMAVSLLAVSGSGQRVLTTTAFSEPLQVAALDSQGSPVSGITIDFSAPAIGASGTFANTGTNTTTAPTNDGGVATTSIFTANDQVGTYTISASASGLGPANFRLEQFVRPANDSFANPVPVPSLPFSRTIDDVTDATIEEGEQQWCYFTDETVWYSFTPSESMIIRTHAQGTANSISGNVNVYHVAGPGISNLQFVSCTGPDGTSTFLAEAGQAYYFQAGSASGQVGGIQINLEQLPFPANDDFANATLVSPPLPFNDIVDTQYSTRQTGEPTPSCAYYGPGTRSVWYAFTPASSGSFSATIYGYAFTPVFAAYTGSSMGNLTQVGCQTYTGNPLTFRANAGTTYYFQVGNLYYWEQGGSMQFHLDATPPPQASFYTNPWDPSKYDTIQFQDSSYDPGQVGFQTYTWDFGDGATATGYSAPHKYAADGDYQVVHTVTTTDGRTATITQTVQVRTHDVAITKITTPASANVGQAKTITVTLRNTAYPETVQIDLYKSTANGFEWVATVTKSVPALSGNRTTAVNFSYTFTSDDATRGKVTFKAVAIIIGARDAYPSDNEAISSITRVAR
jgi:hypothetical protein